MGVRARAAALTHSPPPTAVMNGKARLKSSKSGDLNPPRLATQPLIHHHQALPIFAAFGLRYIHIFVRK
jgi:hypothetical protein